MNNESVGFLQIVAKTANGALPVENAQVNIYEYFPNSESKDGELIYSLLTGSDGRTEKVALGAKSKDLSTSPGNEFPFSVYNLAVAKNGYYTNRYINVPIFQGVSAIQPVELIPLMEFSDENDDLPNASRRFVETPNTDL